MCFFGLGGLSDVSSSLPNQGCPDQLFFFFSLLFTCKVHVKDSEVLFKFFSILWTYSFNLSNHLNYEVNAMLQTRALYIGYAVLVSQTYQKKKQLLSPPSPGEVKSIHLLT